MERVGIWPRSLGNGPGRGGGREPGGCLGQGLGQRRGVKYNDILVYYAIKKADFCWVL